ncbi:hypothetical protein [Adhaeretor mobilis]|uniref:Peptidase C51 domain-containing protein n=1 Tax=Adhaeretor mobilis TaxID=1930276 RepID=A0A517MQH1_9BACT|nr:hypothetical protein [Adhaeretor mobilis]QDS97126.1 hypothetical protein HG15A2_03860 [Adhaeretor mobilis]
MRLPWSGTPEEVRFKGQKILSKGERTYCCGFTFTVAMKVATDRGLLREASVESVRKLQKDWYGTTKESRETQCVFALKKLGIGKAVKAEEAQPGDFVQFWRKKSGHSVIFLEWVVKDGKQVGLKYRSSQPKTNGIGDNVEYFSDSQIKGASIDRSRCHLCRLHNK